MRKHIVSSKSVITVLLLVSMPVMLAMRTRSSSRRFKNWQRVKFSTSSKRMLMSDSVYNLRSTTPPTMMKEDASWKN